LDSRFKRGARGHNWSRNMNVKRHVFEERALTYVKKKESLEKKPGKKENDGNVTDAEKKEGPRVGMEPFVCLATHGKSVERPTVQGP